VDGKKQMEERKMGVMGGRNMLGWEKGKWTKGWATRRVKRGNREGRGSSNPAATRLQKKTGRERVRKLWGMWWTTRNKTR